MSVKKLCGICNEELEGLGNNPAPFDIPPVCNDCDSYVSATRIILIPLIKATVPNPKGRDVTEDLTPVLEQVSRMLQISCSILRVRKEKNDKGDERK